MEHDKEEPKKEGCHSRGHHCCCGKAIAALVLLLLGGVIGYLMGRCSLLCDKKGYGMMSACPMTQTQEKTPSIAYKSVALQQHAAIHFASFSPTFAHKFPQTK